MSQYGEELNMQILQPLDLDSTAGILQLNGYLVPLSEWSKAREGYKSNTDRRAFVIMLCALIGLAVACMEIWATSSCPIRLPTYIHVLVFLMSFGCSRVVLFPSSRMEKIIRPKPDSPSRVLESEFDIHVVGLEDTPLFDKTGYRKILLQTDETHFSPATLFVWEERSSIKEEGIWPMTYIALFDKDGKPIRPQKSEPASQKVVENSEK